MTQCLTHHTAPTVVDGVSPFTTPGTRLTWSSATDWMVCARQLGCRRCSSKTHADQANHLDELARHPDFIAAHDRDDLEQLRDFILRWYQPHRGARAGTSYERVINEINNQLAWLTRAEADADEEHAVRQADIEASCWRNS
jgi:hypothetical protein